MSGLRQHEVCLRPARTQRRCLQLRAWELERSGSRLGCCWVHWDRESIHHHHHHYHPKGGEYKLAPRLWYVCSLRNHFSEVRGGDVEDFLPNTISLSTCSTLFVIVYGKWRGVSKRGEWLWSSIRGFIHIHGFASLIIGLTACSRIRSCPPFLSQFSCIPTRLLLNSKQISKQTSTNNCNNEMLLLLLLLIQLLILLLLLRITIIIILVQKRLLGFRCGFLGILHMEAIRTVHFKSLSLSLSLYIYIHIDACLSLSICMYIYIYTCVYIHICNVM